MQRTITAIMIAAAASSSVAGVVSTDYAVFTKGSFSTGRNVAISGDIAARTSVWIDQGSSVQGSVSYGTDFNAHSSAAFGQVFAPGQWGSPVVPEINVRHAGGGHMWYSNHAQATVAQGSHGRFSTGNNVALTFESGTYSFDHLYTGRDATLTFDTTRGDITIYSSSDISFDRDLMFNVIGDGNVALHAANNFWVGRDGELTASIFAYAGSVSIARDVDITGSVFGATSVWIDRGSTLSFAPVPAPSSAAIMLGFAAIAGRRRR